MTTKTTIAETGDEYLADLLARVDPQLRCLGGSQHDAWNALVGAMISVTDWTAKLSDAETRFRREAVLSALKSIRPNDELEGMMVAQLIASFNATMGCYRHAASANTPLECRLQYLNQANKLSRTWTMLLDALNKHRGKAQQNVRVEHVNVHSGGRAIVGSVDARQGGGIEKSGNQPHAK